MHDYKVGDTIHTKYNRGFSGEGVRSWTVDKITPSGQINASRDGATVKISKNGNVIGGRYADRVVTSQRAAEIRLVMKKDALWNQVRELANHLDKAGRGQDLEGAQEVIPSLRTVLEKLA